ncbi:MAG: hypothetical protein QNJ89_05245 [Acidimicrobiia bacterium]|nr:hypothetical protein [Acidimicrobiia bacterium]
MSDRASISSIGAIGVAAAIGAGLGALLSPVWAIVGGLTGLATALLISVYGVRPVVAVPVALGAGIGAYVGGTIVGVLCEPAGCPAFEAFGAITTGIGALVGVGLVVALTTRSFDEYRESVARRATAEAPPDEDPPSD